MYDADHFSLSLAAMCITQLGTVHDLREEHHRAASSPDRLRRRGTMSKSHHTPPASSSVRSRPTLVGAPLSLPPRSGCVQRVRDERKRGAPSRRLEARSFPLDPVVRPPQAAATGSRNSSRTRSAGRLRPAERSGSGALSSVAWILWLGGFGEYPQADGQCRKGSKDLSVRSHKYCFQVFCQGNILAVVGRTGGSRNLLYDKC